MIKPSKVKTPMNVHTPKSQMGSGDYYGTAIKQKVGRMREDSINGPTMGPKKMGKPPRSLA